MEDGKEYGIWDFRELLGLKESRTKDILKGLSGYIEIVGSNRDRRYKKKINLYLSYLSVSLFFPFKGRGDFIQPSLLRFFKDVICPLVIFLARISYPFRFQTRPPFTRVQRAVTRLWPPQAFHIVTRPSHCSTFSKACPTMSAISAGESPR